MGVEVRGRGGRSPVDLILDKKLELVVSSLLQRDHNTHFQIMNAQSATAWALIAKVYIIMVKTNVRLYISSPVYILQSCDKFAVTW